MSVGTLTSVSICSSFFECWLPQTMGFWSSSPLGLNSRPPTTGITHSIRLQDYDGTSDIRAYLCNGLHRVRDKHPVKDSIPWDWPTEDILNVLVNTASGSYIYLATVVKHLSPHLPRRSAVLSSAARINLCRILKSCIIISFVQPM